jgi:hypothetical protein
LQVIVAEPRNLYIPDPQGERFDEDRVRLVFLEVLWTLQIPLGRGDHLFHRMEGQGCQDDKQQLLFDKFFEIALTEEATVEN